MPEPSRTTNLPSPYDGETLTDATKEQYFGFPPTPSSHYPSVQLNGVDTLSYGSSAGGGGAGNYNNAYANNGYDTYSYGSSNYNAAPAPLAAAGGPAPSGGPTSNGASGAGVQSSSGGGGSYFPPADALLRDSGSLGPSGGGGGSTARQRLSAQLDASDPVALHLLVETALGDAAGYAVLSFDEVEGLKRERGTLGQRAEGLRKKLALETKVRDAAASLKRLGKKDSGPGGAPDSEAELAESEKKCEGLARELWGLESRVNEVEGRLLRHTAGVLQLSHGQREERDGSGLVNGAVGERGMYTMDLGRTEGSRAINEDMFDERSLYRLPENLDVFMEAIRSGAGVKAGGGSSARQGQPAMDDAHLKDLAVRLESFNTRIRDLIVQARLSNPQEYALPPQAGDLTLPLSGGQAASVLDPQLEFMDAALANLSGSLAGDRDDTRARVAALNQAIYDVLAQGQDAADVDEYGDPVAGPPPPPSSSQADGASLASELAYAEDSLETLRTRTQGGSASGLGPASGKAAEYEAALLDLWGQIGATDDGGGNSNTNSMMFGTAPAPSALGPASPVSPSSPRSPTEPFSLPAFVHKVQRLHARASAAREQMDILRRQIQQQRELNSASDAEKEAKVAELDAAAQQAARERDDALRRLDDALRAHQQHELQQAGALDAAATLDEERAARRRAEDARDDARDDARIAQAEAEARVAEADERATEAEAALADQRQALEGARRDLAGAAERVAALEASRDAATGQVAALEARLGEATEGVAALEARLGEAGARADGAERRAAASEDEARGLEADVVRLTTEVALAKAELDGAYGSRAERAAEAHKASAASAEQELAGLRRERDEVAGRAEALKAELAQLVGEFEELTRAGVEAEREREGLERLVDGLRDKVEGLEGQLSEERVRWLGVRSPGAQTEGAGAGPGGGREMTSMMVLRNEFKKMMRDTRAENLKTLRAEQEERRKLEALVRQLRREQAPGKSGLSQSMTPS
ncbi:Up-regulated during septation-domain-containing protein [Lineolata rhizophorae]|uniref:Up-regulated during septation-domain-containing protein n=1 Tax=Lineolata rhizophorae TaxID=578093 RepID=A0A6A6PA79_9PEZI|nr:Up-regulated during septation-domain-containing protein [Lineolata rhizophorae]